MCDSNVLLIVWAGLGLYLEDYIIRTEFQFSPSIYPSDKAALVKLKRQQKTDQKVGEERE